MTSVWICVEKGNKLSGCVHEGHWVGVDDESNECQIYWQDTKTVTVECNIYFNPASMSVDHIEGEDWEFVKTTTDKLTSTPQSCSPTIITPHGQSEPAKAAPAGTPAESEP